MALSSNKNTIIILSEDRALSKVIIKTFREKILIENMPVNTEDEFEIIPFDSLNAFFLTSPKHIMVLFADAGIVNQCAITDFFNLLSEYHVQNCIYISNKYATYQNYFHEAASIQNIVWLQKPVIPGNLIQHLKYCFRLDYQNQVIKATHHELTSYKKAVDYHAVIFIVDVDVDTLPETEGKIVYHNKAYRDVTGFSKEDLAEKPFDIATIKIQQNENGQAIWILLKQGKVWNGMVIDFKIDGDCYWAKSTILPISESYGTHFRYMVIQNDVTEIIKMQEELQRSNDRSVRMIKELDEAWYSIQSANDAKSRFLASMSHEIRTPINGMIGMTDMLIGTNLNFNQVKYVETINACGQALLSIVNDILDFSKIEAGEYKIDIFPLNLRNLIEDVVLTGSHAALVNELELTYVFEPNMPLDVEGDKKSIQQVLINLVSNALKFTHKGHVLICLSLVNTEPGQHPVYRFEVNDTGIGLTKDEQSKIFKRFVQADSSTSRKYGGTGLGLNISGELVRMMNGELTVESEPDKGSCFFFEIPLKLQDKQQHIDSSVFAGFNLLIFEREDELIPYSPLCKHLDEHQINFHSITSEAECFEMIKQGNKIDLMIISSDSQNIELVKKIRDNDVKLPIIFYLKFGETINESLWQSLKVSGSIYRPVRHAQLINTITNTLAIEKLFDDTSLVGQTDVKLSGNVLVVDDNQTNRVVAQAILESFGIKSEIANDGYQALELFSKIAFDLILMDYQMPELDGAETAIKIREIEKQDNRDPVPIVALTADALEETRQICLKAGMNDFLTKPIRKEQLLNLVNRWLPEQTATNVDDDLGQKNSQNKMLPDPAIDKKMMEILKQSVGKQFDKLVQIYIEDINRFKAELDEAIAINDNQMLAKKAHAIKGNYGTIGANQLIAYCKAIEIQIDENDYESIDQNIQMLFKELQRVGEALTPFLADPVVEAIKQPKDSTPIKPENCIDKRQLQYLKDAVGDQFDHLITIYIDDTQRFKKELSAAYERNDYHELAKKAHSIKGNYSNVGAIHLGGLCKELELAAKENKIDQLVPLMQQIFDALNHVAEMLKNHQLHF